MVEPPETLPGTLSGADATLPGASAQHDVATAPGITGKTLVATSSTVQPQQAGQTVGRFRIERQLGAGAMGVVLLAHDPDLARPVAIKLLKSEGEDAAARLRREAQAVAKIQHPNVIAVHEVGTHGDQVYVVMEFVDGGTLRDWAKAQPRSWQDVLSVYQQAGRGLIAAHQAGLVHRDFKPDNVLIGSDGRVRVTDFGIVGVAGASSLANTMQNASAPLDEISARLTQTGAIIGTPAYMPPEQYESGLTDARSDQFAFCVSLYEALFGMRPHEGDTVGALLYSVQSGKVRAVPETDAPLHVVSAVMQGLRPDPARRHVSMDALLLALEPRKAKPVWPWVAGAAGLLAVAGGGLAAYALSRPTKPEPAAASSETTFTCPDAKAQFAAVWNAERREQLQPIFVKHGAVAEASFTKVTKALDARQDAWTWAFDSACAARTAKEDEGETYEAKRVCLSRALSATDAYVAVLLQDERDFVDGAVSSVTMLPRVEDCADAEMLESRVRPSVEQEEAIAGLEREFLSARLLLLAGKHHEAIAAAEALERQAREIGFDGVTAAVLEVLARGKMQLGQIQQAESLARESAQLAAQAGDAAVEARAFATLIYVVGHGGARGAEALGMLTTGEAVYARTRHPRARSYFKSAEANVRATNGELEAAEDATTAVIEILEALDPAPPDELSNAYVARSAYRAARGDLPGSRADQGRALGIAEEGLGKKHTIYGAITMSLGQAAQAAGDSEEALRWYQATFEAWDASLEKNHTSNALILSEIGKVQIVLGRYDDAAASLEESQRRLQASGNEDPNTSLSLHQNLAQLAFFRGDFDEAEAQYTAAAALVRKMMGAENPSAALFDQAVGSMRHAKGDDAGALKWYRAAKVALVKAYGPKHAQVAQASALVGDALQWLDRCAEATREYGETFRIYNDLSLAPDLTLIQAVAGQGVCELALDKHDAAEASLARAMEMLETLELVGEPEAVVRFALAKGHLGAGHRETADELSAAAESIYDRLGPGWDAPLTKVRKWRSEAGF